MDNVATRVLRKAEMEKELQQLLSAEAGIRSDSYLLTFYFPMENLKRSDAEKHLKSNILDCLRKDEKITGMGKLIRRLLKQSLPNSETSMIWEEDWRFSWSSTQAKM